MVTKPNNPGRGGQTFASHDSHVISRCATFFLFYFLEWPDVCSGRVAGCLPSGYWSRSRHYYGTQKFSRTERRNPIAPIFTHSTQLHAIGSRHARVSKHRFRVTYFARCWGRSSQKDPPGEPGLLFQSTAGTVISTRPARRAQA